MKEIIFDVFFLVAIFAMFFYHSMEAMKAKKKKKCFIHALVAGICFWALISRFIYVLAGTVKHMHVS